MTGGGDGDPQPSKRPVSCSFFFLSFGQDNLAACQLAVRVSQRRPADDHDGSRCDDMPRGSSLAGGPIPLVALLVCPWNAEFYFSACYAGCHGPWLMLTAPLTITSAPPARPGLTNQSHADGWGVSCPYHGAHARGPLPAPPVRKGRRVGTKGSWGGARQQLPIRECPGACGTGAGTGTLAAALDIALSSAFDLRRPALFMRPESNRWGA